MSNLLDLEDNFPQNPFEEGTTTTAPTSFGGVEQTPQEFTREFSPVDTPQQPTSNPSSQPPVFGSFGDSISNDSEVKPYGSQGVDKSNIQSILQGDSLFSVPRATENDEKLRVWRNNHNQELVKRAEESRTKTEEQRKKAQKELEEFYQKRNEQIQNKHKENSESQKDVVNKREEVEKLGNKWERVRHLIDVKGTEKSTDAKDTSRLRSVLIKMWNKK